MVNKLEKDSNFTKRASQQSNKAQPLKRQQKSIEDEKIKYARSAYLMQEGLITRMALVTRWEISTTLG
jgi:hypothetical protein